MNNNVNILNSLEIGDTVLIKYNEDFSKVATYYGKENSKYIFKDIDGLFEFSVKFIESNLEIEKVKDY